MINKYRLGFLNNKHANLKAHRTISDRNNSPLFVSRRSCAFVVPSWPHFWGVGLLGPIDGQWEAIRSMILIWIDQCFQMELLDICLSMPHMSNVITNVSSNELEFKLCIIFFASRYASSDNFVVEQIKLFCGQNWSFFDEMCLFFAVAPWIIKQLTEINHFIYLLRLFIYSLWA